MLQLIKRESLKNSNILFFLFFSLNLLNCTWAPPHISLKWPFRFFIGKKRERREKEKYRKFSSSSCKNIWSTLSERWRDREILEREEEARPNKKNGKKDRLNSLYIDRMRETER